jgi:hypothetical protein
MCPPRIIAKESALEKKLLPAMAGDGLLAGIDQIRVDGVCGRKRADAEQAVLRLQGDRHAFGNEVGDQGRNADAEIHVVAVAQFLAARWAIIAQRDSLADGAHPAVVRNSMRFS